MDNKIKNYLGIALVLAVFVFATGYLGYVNSYSKSIQPGSYRSFSVNGEGRVTAIPDIAQFTFSVITEGKDIATLQGDNTGITNKAIDFLKNQGVETKDIKTQNYSLEPKYETYYCPRPESSIIPCPPATIVGYTITQTVSVKIRDFEKIGSIVEGVVASGANSVSQLYFAIDDTTFLQNEARAKAIEKAKDQAKKTAEAGGFGIGKLISITEGYYSPYYGYGMGGAMKTDSAAPSSVPAIEPGSQEITVNVTLIYEIQ